jgi:hypothetical protein
MIGFCIANISSRVAQRLKLYTQSWSTIFNHLKAILVLTFLLFVSTNRGWFCDDLRPNVDSVYDENGILSATKQVDRQACGQRQQQSQRHYRPSRTPVM